MKPIRMLVLLLLPLLTAAAVGADYPLTVTDDLGREVVLEEAPRRVATMIPSHTETVCALACDLLVGVDQFSDFPEQIGDLPKLGSAFSANIEELVALQPDLVLVDEYSGLAERLEELGITVYAGTPQRYDEVFESFAVVGLMLDRETEAAVLAGRVRGEVSAVADLVAGLDAPSVYYELDATPYSVGPGSFIDELITRAGGENIVAAGMGEYPQLDPEFVVAQNPQVIVLADAPYGETAETIAARPGWAGIAAIESNRVAELSQEQANALSRPGPRLGQAVVVLARILHPDRF